MTYLAAMILLYVERPADAWVVLANILNRRCSFDMYRLDRPAIEKHVRVFDYFFRREVPELKQHFEEEGVESEFFFLDWSLTLFVRALPLDVCARVWDCYLEEGEVLGIRVGVALLAMHQTTLRKRDSGGALRFLGDLPADLEPETLLAAAEATKISAQEFESVWERVSRGEERGRLRCLIT